MLNHKIFSFGEPSRLIDDEFVDRDLSDIMDLGGGGQSLNLSGRDVDLTPKAADSSST